MNRPSTLAIFEALDDRGIIVTQSSSCQGWYFYDVEDMDDVGNVAAADRKLYDTAEEAAWAGYQWYRLG